MGNGGLIIAGPVDVFMDPDGGSDFLAANQLNFSGEAVTIENQPELFQLGVDQRGTHIRQTLNKIAVVVKLKIEESSLKNIASAFPFAQYLPFGDAAVQANEVYLGISDGTDSIRFFSILLKGKNPKGKDLEVYIPRAVVRGTSTIEHKRDATQGIPIEIMAIAPNECDTDLLDDEGSFAAVGDWTLGTGITISGGTLNAVAATDSATQDFSTSLFPRSDGLAGAFDVRGKTKYRVVLEVTAYTDGDIDVSLAGLSPVTLGITAAGKFEADFLINVEPPADSILDLAFTSAADMTVDNVRVFPIRAVNFKEF